MIVWVPCILLGIWALGDGMSAASSNAILGKMVGIKLRDPLLTGLLTAGILAAIMSSLDSQFVCLGTIFTHDIVIHAKGEDHYTDKQKIMLGRMFILFIVAVTYTLSLFPPDSIFDLAVWCFSGFSSLFPLVFAALYWRRVTRAGAFASILVAAGTWIYFFYQGLIKPSFAAVKPAVKEDYLVMGMMPVAIMFAASALVLIVVSLMTQPPPKSVVDSFFDDRKA
jgi:SSS family solute:Na+ symporter